MLREQKEAQVFLRPLPCLLPEVASRQLLQARRHSAVQAGLAALPRSLHEQQGWELQQQPDQGEPTLHMATQLGPDHAWVKRER